jgi:hypothetical protein
VFVSARRLVQVDAYNGGSTASTVSLSCNGTLATQLTVGVHETRSVPMGWIGVCNTVNIGSSNGWDTNFDNLVVDTPAGTPTPTPTPTPTATPAESLQPTSVTGSRGLTPVPTQSAAHQ